MPIEPGPAAEIITALPYLVRPAANANDLLLDLVSALRPVIPDLWRASIRRFLPRENQLELIAVWSASDTQLLPGTRHSAAASSMPEVLSLGRPVFSGDARPERTLLDQVLATEGIGSWVSIPLRARGRIAGLLSLAAIEADAIVRSDSEFFEQLGNSVEDSFGELSQWSIEMSDALQRSALRRPEVNATSPKEDQLPKTWARWWLWLWGLVALALLGLAFALPFKWWALAAAIGFGSMEAIGLAHPNDAYPPLTHVIRTYVPRWVAFTAIYGFTGAAGATWLGLPRPGRIGLLFALLGWFTTHFDVTFDEAKSQQEGAKYGRLYGTAARVLRRNRTS